jgi:hypothetical protein
VQQGKKYRMRLINNSGFGHFHVRFEGHPMTVIEADGILHQPLLRDEVELYPAQRYSVIVSAITCTLQTNACSSGLLDQIDANQPVGNYWIYVSWLQPCCVLLAKAVRYVGADGDEGSFEEPQPYVVVHAPLTDRESH